MLLILNAFITDIRSRGNRYPRIDIFKYSVYSYRNIKFNEIYFFIKLDNNYLDQTDNLLNFIYSNFSYLDKKDIHVTFNRLRIQGEWYNLITSLYDKLGGNEPVLFLNNDDHVFVDYNTELLEEGLNILSNDTSLHKSIYISHWPEIIRLSGKYNTPERVGNFINFKLTLLDSIQIFNLEFLKYILVTYIWKKEHPRIDDILNEISHTDVLPCEHNTLSQTIYVPLKELFRKFDGYSHVGISHDCPPLVLPYNIFYYDRNTLISKITAAHNSPWTVNNTFHIPKEWVDVSLSLHNKDYHEIINLNEEFYNYFILKPNMHNSIYINNSSICKTGPLSTINGEIFYYTQLSNFPTIINYFPKYISHSINNNSGILNIEYIKGVSLFFLFKSNLITPTHIDKILDSLNTLHSIKGVCNITVDNIINNYKHKLMQRFSVLSDYPFEDSKDIQDICLKRLNLYLQSDIKPTFIIHGDYWFSNMIMDFQDNLKVFDMRGQVDNILTTSGDKLYDYAKLYQSILGYDCILNDTPFPENSRIIKQYYEVKMEELCISIDNLTNITFSLVIGTIPFIKEVDKKRKIWEWIKHTFL